MTAWLSKRQTAEALGVTVKTLDEWTAKGTGPPRIKLGTTRQATVRYDPEAVREWMRQHAV
jgi:predicted DNA-binding transcriptional regulator AlpA